MRTLPKNRRLSACSIALLFAASSVTLAGARTQTNAEAGNSSPQTQNKQADAHNTQTNFPQYEVASIKTHKSEGMMMQAGFRVTPDGVSISGVPLSMLMSQAFGLPDGRILNEPAWAGSDRYDIEAKVEPTDAPKLDKLTQNQRMAMLLPLLEDRFGLKFHHETKVMEVYTLVVAKGGPKLQPAQTDVDREVSSGPSRPFAGVKPDGDTPPKGDEAGGPGMPAGPGPGTKPPPGAMMMRISPQGMTLRGVGITTSQLAEMIERELGNTVVDQTGLSGKYDYTLTFAPDVSRGPMGAMPPPPPSGAAPSGVSDASTPASAPSLFTAVQEQLGLKLVARKEPVDVIVIDRLEQPSPN